MTRTWFSEPLETVATWWRILRCDGVTLGFTTHDADLWFDGVLHRAGPGIMPSAVRRSADFQPDSAEVQGAITHEAIDEGDLIMGRFDGARVVVGLVDWESLEVQAIYRGTIGEVAEQSGTFSAQLVSRKTELARDPVPRTSPACRAQFCGPGCGLSSAAHTFEVSVTACDLDANAVVLAAPVDAARFVEGSLRWLDGPMAGQLTEILADTAQGMVLGRPLDIAVQAGTRALVREGCDRTLQTCSTRFANAINFRGEPYVPGNDLLARYGTGH